MKIVELVIRIVSQIPYLNFLSDAVGFVTTLFDSTKKQEDFNETKQMQSRKKKYIVLLKFVISIYTVILFAMLPILEKLMLDFGYQPFISKYEMLENAIHSSFNGQLFIMSWFILYFASWQALDNEGKKMVAVQFMRLPNCSHDMRTFVRGL